MITFIKNILQGNGLIYKILAICVLALIPILIAKNQVDADFFVAKAENAISSGDYYKALEFLKSYKEKAQTTDSPQHEKALRLYRLVLESGLFNTRKTTTPAQIKDLVKEGADVNAKNAGGWTPLSTAALKGHTNAVKGLIAAGADVNATSESYTPLHEAASYGRSDVVKALIEAGADVDARDGNGRGPLQFAAQNNYSDTVRILIKAGADVNLKANDGYTPLSAAEAFGHTDIVSILKKARATK